MIRKNDHLVIYKEIDVNRHCPAKGEKTDLNTQASSVFSPMQMDLGFRDCITKIGRRMGRLIER